jgi:hypothetical protein
MRQMRVLIRTEGWGCNQSLRTGQVNSSDNSYHLNSVGILFRIPVVHVFLSSSRVLIHSTIRCCYLQIFPVNHASVYLTQLFYIGYEETIKSEVLRGVRYRWLTSFWRALWELWWRVNSVFLGYLPTFLGQNFNPYRSNWSPKKIVPFFLRETSVFMSTLWSIGVGLCME